MRRGEQAQPRVATARGVAGDAEPAVASVTDERDNYGYAGSSARGRWTTWFTHGVTAESAHGLLTAARSGRYVLDRIAANSRLSAVLDEVVKAAAGLCRWREAYESSGMRDIPGTLGCDSVERSPRETE